MKKLLSSLTLALIAVSFSALAAAPKLTVSEKVEINASAKTVWAKVQNFGDLGAFHPAVKTTEITSGTNNKVGAKRLLTLQDGGTINETLTKYDKKKMMYGYIITDGVLPVSNYSAVIKVKALGKDKSVVTWNANFKRKDLADAPAAGQDDKAATDTITGVFKGGLENLKKISEVAPAAESMPAAK